MALGAVLLGGGVAHAQFMPPASITDGMASRPAARAVGVPVAPGAAAGSPYAPVTYGAANTPPAAYATPAPTPAYAPVAYGPGMASAYPSGAPAGYAPAGYAPAAMAGYPAAYGGYAPGGSPGQDAMASPMAGYPVPPPPPRVANPGVPGGPAPYATPLITTAVSEQQNPPAPAMLPAYGYGDAGMAVPPPSMTSVAVAPVAYASLPPSVPGARALTPVAGSTADMARQSLAEGDFVRAQSGLEEAIRVNPFDPAALNNLAVAKAEQGQYNDALGLLERATRLAPGDAEIAANFQRMRAFLNSYAMAGTAAPTPAAAAASPGPAGSLLPPPPPPLWTRPGTAAGRLVVAPVAPQGFVAPPVVYGSVPATPVYYTTSVGTNPQGYYTSGACENGMRRTARGTVEVCQTTR